MCGKKHKQRCLIEKDQMDR